MGTGIPAGSRSNGPETGLSGKTSWPLRCPLTWPHLFVPLSVIWSVPLFRLLVLYSLLTTCPKIGFPPPSRSTVTTPILPCPSFIWPSFILNAPRWTLGFLGAVLSLQLHGIFSESKEYFSIFLWMFHSTQLTVEPALPPGFPFSIHRTTQTETLESSLTPLSPSSILPTLSPKR